MQYPFFNVELGSVIAAIIAALAIILPIYKARMRRKRTRQSWLNSQKTLKGIAGSNNIDNALRDIVTGSNGVIGQAILHYAHNGGFDIKAGSPLNMHWAYVQDEIRLQRFGVLTRMDRVTRKAIYSAFSEKACHVAYLEDWELGEFQDWMRNHMVDGYFIMPIGLMREMNALTKKPVETVITLWIEFKEGSSLKDLYADANFREYLRGHVSFIKDLYEEHRSKDFNRFI
jgi:hypothetical protein